MKLKFKIVVIIFFVFTVFAFIYKKDSNIFLTNINNITVYSNADTSAIFFTAGMTIDADGSPRAYCAADTGLDYLKNAGIPGHWCGLACDSTGIPFVQTSTDINPGFYISTTSLFDEGWKIFEPRRYVDAENYPYIALPQDLMKISHVKLGDIAIVIRQNDTAFAIVADVGPRGKLGEGSIALANNLNIPSSPKTGGLEKGITYIVYPQSGRGNGVIPKRMEIKLKAYNLTNAFLASQRAIKK